MAFTIPNESDADYGPQAEPDSVDFSIIATGVAGNGVIDGGEITAGTGMTVDYAAMRVLIDGVVTSIASGSTTALSDGGSDPRFDLIVTDGSSVSIVAGTAAAAPEFTPPAADEVVLAAVYVPANRTSGNGGTEAGMIVDKRMLVRPDGRRNLLSPATGVVGDGVADDSVALKGAFDEGGAWWVPDGTYLINAAAGIVVSAKTGLDIECSPNAVFKAGTNVGETTGTASMIKWSTQGGNDAANDLRPHFRFFGGIVDVGQQRSSNTLPESEYTPANPATGTGPNTTDAFKIGHNSRWSNVLIDSTIFTSVSGSWVKDFREGQHHHWLNGGGDCHIQISSGPGSATIRNTVHLGARDLAIYVSNDAGGVIGGDDNLANVLIDGVKMFWCMGGVSLKRNTLRARVSNCYAYNCVYPFFASRTDSGGPEFAQGRPDGVAFSDCIVDGYRVAFESKNGDRTHFTNCQAYNAGTVDDSATPAVFTTGTLSEDEHIAFSILAADGCVISNPSIYGTKSETSDDPDMFARAFEISSDDDTQTTGTIITNTVADGIQDLGGEVAGGTADPDRTKFNGIELGEDMDDYSGPTLTGTHSFADFNDSRTSHARADRTTTSSSWQDITDFSWPIKKDAVYAVEGYLIFDGASGDDIKFKFDGLSAADGGGYQVTGANQNQTSLAGKGSDRDVLAWNVAANGFATVGTGAGNKHGVYLHGTLIADATTTATLQFAIRNTPTGTNTLYAGSYVTFRRIG